jgi:hypothetical protein
MPAAERPDAKIPTRNPQRGSGGAGRGRAVAGPGRAGVRRHRDPAGGAAGAASSPVPESREPMVTEQGITIYPARCEGDRWRAAWYEPDGSRGQCQSVSEHGLAAKLEKVTERLAADVPNMLRSGSELIAYYLSDDRRPAERVWSRRHADTQRDLCTRYLEPMIGKVASTAACSRLPIWRRDGGADRQGGPGTACGTCSIVARMTSRPARARRRRVRQPAWSCQQRGFRR